MTCCFMVKSGETVHYYYYFFSMPYLKRVVKEKLNILWMQVIWNDEYSHKKRFKVWQTSVLWNAIIYDVKSQAVWWERFKYINNAHI